jgi:predicted DNA-binding transcriptional regulator YafY
MKKREYLLRYITIIKKLQKSKVATFNEINEYLEQESRMQGYEMVISKRTFQRDLEEIRSLFNVDIQFDFKRRLYFIPEDENYTDINNRMLESFELFNTMYNAKDFEPFVFFEKRKPIGTHHFYGLLHAIKNNFLIKFSYQKYWEDEITNRTVEPYALKESQFRWYLLAKDYKDNKIKTFGLDRISELNITTKHFIYPKGLDINERFRYCFGIISIENQKPEKIILSFDYEQGKYIKSFPFHESQHILSENENEVQVGMELYITYDFIKELLSWGETVKIIKPIRLINIIKKSLKANLLLYE